MQDWFIPSCRTNQELGWVLFILVARITSCETRVPLARPCVQKYELRRQSDAGSDSVGIRYSEFGIVKAARWPGREWSAERNRNRKGLQWKGYNGWSRNYFWLLSTGLDVWLLLRLSVYTEAKNRVCRKHPLWRYLWITGVTIKKILKKI